MNRKIIVPKIPRAIAGISLALALAALTGCGLGVAGPGTASSAAPIVAAKPVATGSAFGGRQAITGATVQLWGVGTTGYGSASTSLTFTYNASTVSAVTSDGSGVGGNITNANNTLPAGSFTLSPGGTPLYSCPSSDLVYMTITGGNSGGGGNNANSVIASGLGSCATLSSTQPFVFVNELTTVATAYALARFSNSYSAIGAPSTNLTGLAAAFAAINKLVNTSTGQLAGPALPTGATLPTAEMNSLGNILAYCVNSTGTTTGAGDGTPCGSLFLDTKPTGSSAPTDTFGAAVDIALNPVNSSIFGLTTSNGPYQSTLTSTPNNWMIGVNYTGAGLNAPNSLALDSSGNVWLANGGSGANSVSELSNTGAAISTSSGYTAGPLSAPSALAFDLSGNLWVANKTGNNVTEFAAGNPSSATNYTGTANISAPTGVAVDGLGNVWVANSGVNSVTELSSSTGALVGNYASIAGLSTPNAIAVNAH